MASFQALMARHCWKLFHSLTSSHGGGVVWCVVASRGGGCFREGVLSLNIGVGGGMKYDQRSAIVILSFIS